MFVLGAAGASLLSHIFDSKKSQSSHSRFQQIQNEFEQLGQDLQSGNLTLAKKDFTNLSQDIPSAQQNNKSPIAKAFGTLGQALRSPSLSAAERASSTVNSTGSRNGSLAGDLGSLEQALQSENLLSARTAFATLQKDFEQFATGSSYSSMNTSGSSTQSSGTLNLSV
jgi:hypothetical protein